MWAEILNINCVGWAEILDKNCVGWAEIWGDVQRWQEVSYGSEGEC